ncbi:unnamed protein product [Auanema sp. JU1783]|nr:unnamed protein product [Auanema sp. JU1783]
MFNRALLAAARQTIGRRSLHKGTESTPPLRFTSTTEKVGLYSLIAFAFLSYPTYVLLNLDNLRPKGDNFLAPEVQEEIDAIRAARK